MEETQKLSDGKTSFTMRTMLSTEYEDNKKEVEKTDTEYDTTTLEELVAKLKEDDFEANKDKITAYRKDISKLVAVKKAENDDRGRTTLASQIVKYPESHANALAWLNSLSQLDYKIVFGTFVLINTLTADTKKKSLTSAGGASSDRKIKTKTSSTGSSGKPESAVPQSKSTETSPREKPTRTTKSSSTKDS